MAEEIVCASALRYEGRTYTGHGELRTEPSTACEPSRGSISRCGDDPGGRVTVHELRDGPAARAVLANGTVFVADERPFPETTRGWFRYPGCTTTGSFTVTGTWLRVWTRHEPRFDGELRPPYTLDLHVTPTDEAGAAYDRWTIGLRVTRATSPTRKPEHVKRSLSRGGKVRATVHCEGEAFVADRLSAASPA